MTRQLAEETRELLLDSAEYRFWNFGFKKTTIDEIAADVRIGKGSLYQFFESKEALVLATIARHKRILLEEQKVLSQDTQMAPPEKVRRITKHPILDTHARFERYPHGQDMIVSFHTALPSLLQPMIEEEVALLADVLAEGRQQGYFTFSDANKTAWNFRNMTYGFWPPYSCVQGLTAVDAALDRLLDLVFQGLCVASS